jgi:hypothetical protein
MSAGSAGSASPDHAAGAHRRWWVVGLWVLVVPLVVAVLLSLGLLTAALQHQPQVQSAQDVGPEDVGRAVSLLRTHDPRQARPGQVSTALLSQRDLDVLLGHGLHRWLDAQGSVTLEPARATLRLSTRGPAHPLGDWLGRWLNLELVLAETGGLPQLDSLRLGHLRLPAWLAEWAAPRLAARWGLAREWQLAGEVVRRVHFQRDTLLVTYAWQGDSVNRLVDGLLTPAELARLRPYSDLLVRLAAQSGPDWRLPVVQLMRPMFDLARQRSGAGTSGDTNINRSINSDTAAAENRAALLALTLYANGRWLGHVSATARSWPRPRPLQLLLAGRGDFTLHFLISALLAAEGTTPLSRAVGIYKEIADSRGGSGFSFNDIAADRAGTRFGERAVREPGALQALVARGVSDADLMPRFDDLPEFMAEPEFLRRFGGVGAPAYNQMIAEIDRRVDGLAFTR